MSLERTWFISAGEYSGDILARDLVNHVKKTHSNIDFFGIGGPEMDAAGVELTVNLSRLSVMGILEVLSKIIDIVEIEQRVLEAVERRKPDVCVLVDFPGFHFRLAKRLKQRGFKVVQYVAPKVWAWGTNRVYKLKKDFDKVLGVLPFEEDFFLNHGVNYKYVGSPHIDRVNKLLDGKELLSITQEDFLAVLPGSRHSEIKRVVPEVRKILDLLDDKMTEVGKSLNCVIPVAASLNHKLVIEAFTDENASIPATLETPFQFGRFTFVEGASLEVMKKSKAAILTSGTATLECGLLKTPMVVIYVMNKISYLIAKLKLKIKWISLVNLSLSSNVVSEYIQNIKHGKVAEELFDLMNDSERKKIQVGKLKVLSSIYHGEAEKIAADEIFALVGD